MNRNDIIQIAERLRQEPLFRNFKVRKKDGCLIERSKYGFRRVWFHYYNSYDLDRDALALSITPNIDIRFNVLRKWFEKYSLRSLDDQRDGTNIGFTSRMLGYPWMYYFLEDRSTYEEDYAKLCHDVVEMASKVFTDFDTLEKVYKYKVEDILSGERELIGEGLEMETDMLILTRIVNLDRYPEVKTFAKKKIEELAARKNAEIMLYYDRLDTIFADLESIDFTKDLPPKDKNGHIRLP